jgi:hypothetical protein
MQFPWPAGDLAFNEDFDGITGKEKGRLIYFQ